MTHTLNYAPPDVPMSWQLIQRAMVFLLAATSIWCLLAEFYRVVSMQAFTIRVFIPAAIALAVWAMIDRGDVRRMVWQGALAGFLAACAYDIFRLPFVFAKPWHIDSVVPAMPLFKVFPQ